MSFKDRVIRCDAPGCRRQLAAPGASVADLRRLALERGWTRDGRGGDRCPGHRDDAAGAAARGVDALVRELGLVPPARAARWRVLVRLPDGTEAPSGERDEAGARERFERFTAATPVDSVIELQVRDGDGWRTVERSGLRLALGTGPDDAPPDGA